MQICSSFMFRIHLSFVLQLDAMQRKTIYHLHSISLFNGTHKYNNPYIVDRKCRICLCIYPSVWRFRFNWYYHWQLFARFIIYSHVQVIRFFVRDAPISYGKTHFASTIYISILYVCVLCKNIEVYWSSGRT